MTEDTPSISVVVPTRDRVALIPILLATLHFQETEVPFEVVIVDNGSTDGTTVEVGMWQEYDGRIRLLREPRPGRSAAMNAGVAASRGSLLLFTDDDVSVGPGWVEGYHRFFEGRDGLLIAGGRILPVPGEEGWPAWFPPRCASTLPSVDWGEERPLAEDEHVWGANMAVPREVFEDLGGWDEGLGVRGADHPSLPWENEDIELQMRLRRAGGTVWFCPAPLVRHRTPVPGPRRVLAGAFSAGRNDRVRAARPGRPAAMAPAQSSTLAAIRLAGSTVRWSVWSAAFRARRSPRAFEHAWRAAWSAGFGLEDLLGERDRDRTDRVARRLMGVARSLALRLAPARR